jgi:hypothetical protein
MTLIHSFHSDDNFGYEPLGSLVLIRNTLYGTTSGNNLSGGCGVVFEAGMRADSFYDVLHTFTDGSDGCGSEAGLAAGPKHFLYGDTRGGGPDGDGTVFRIRP